MKKILKRRRLIRQHKENIRIYEKIFNGTDDLVLQEYIVKRIEMCKKTIKKLKRL